MPNTRTVKSVITLLVDVEVPEDDEPQEYLGALGSKIVDMVNTPHTGNLRSNLIRVEAISHSVAFF